MSNLQRPFRLNVGFIMHEEVGFRYEFTFEFPQIRVADDLELADFQGLLSAGRTPQGLLFTGSFAADLDLECVRCLRVSPHRLKWSLTEHYAFGPEQVSDSGLIVPEDAHVDIEPLIREYALLEVPINPICRADCKGLCPVCGQDLNVRDCGHRTQERLSPFASLKDFLDR